MDLGMAPIERACLICVFTSLVWCCNMYTCHRIQVNICRSYYRMGTCFVNSIWTRHATTKQMAGAERAHPICIFQLLVHSLVVRTDGRICAWIQTMVLQVSSLIELEPSKLRISRHYHLKEHAWNMRFNSWYSVAASIYGTVLWWKQVISMYYSWFSRFFASVSWIALPGGVGWTW